MIVPWRPWWCCFFISFAVLGHLPSSFLCLFLWDFFTFVSSLALLSLAFGCPFLWAFFSLRAIGLREFIISFLSFLGALHRRSFFTSFGLTLLGHPLEVCWWWGSFPWVNLPMGLRVPIIWVLMFFLYESLEELFHQVVVLRLALVAVGVAPAGSPVLCCC